MVNDVKFYDFYLQLELYEIIRGRSNIAVINIAVYKQAPEKTLA